MLDLTCRKNFQTMFDAMNKHRFWNRFACWFPHNLLLKVSPHSVSYWLRAHLQYSIKWEILELRDSLNFVCILWLMATPICRNQHKRTQIRISIVHIHNMDSNVKWLTWWNACPLSCHERHRQRVREAKKVKHYIDYFCLSADNI